MQKFVITLGVLSLLTLTLAAGGLIFWTLGSADDAGFVRDYLLRMDPAERATLRDFTRAQSRAGPLTDERLREYFFDRELQGRMEEARKTPGFDAVALDTLVSRREAHEDDQTALDQFAARRGAYDDYRARATQDLAAAAQTQARYEKLTKEWDDRLHDARLQQLVADLDKSREPENLLPQLQYLPLTDLYIVLTGAKNKDSRAAIFNALPVETQKGLAQLGSNPAGR